jgi:HTH-type transcriptional regulator/antitoxin HigA
MRKRGFFNTSESLPELKEYAQERVTAFLKGCPSGMDLGPIMLKTAAHYRCNDKEVNPLALWAWQARVLSVAAQSPLNTSYKKGTVDLEFMRSLSQLSWSDKGPLYAKEFLNKHGIHLVIEPHFKQTY